MLDCPRTASTRAGSRRPGEPLVPGTQVEGLLRRPGERHLHLLELEQTSLVTAKVNPESEVELLVFDERFERVRHMVQCVLGKGRHWLEVSARPAAQDREAHYGFRVHCVAL